MWFRARRRPFAGPLPADVVIINWAGDARSAHVRRPAGVPRLWGMELCRTGRPGPADPPCWAAAAAGQPQSAREAALCVMKCSICSGRRLSLLRGEAGPRGGSRSEPTTCANPSPSSDLCSILAMIEMWCRSVTARRPRIKQFQPKWRKWGSFCWGIKNSVRDWKHDRRFIWRRGERTMG